MCLLPAPRFSRREKRLMRTPPFPGTLPQPGEEVRWRHPRRALALGWFDVFGPGPFTLVGVLDRSDQDVPLAFVIQTEFGDKEIDAVWLGPASS
jgi:hypothetical protein